MVVSEQKVLDGYVRYISHMGNDNSPLEAMIAKLADGPDLLEESAP